jgi:hypothetical protein
MDDLGPPERAFPFAYISRSEASSDLMLRSVAHLRDQYVEGTRQGPLPKPPPQGDGGMPADQDPPPPPPPPDLARETSADELQQALKLSMQQ